MKFYNILAVILMAFTFKVSAGLPSYVGTIDSVLVGKVYQQRVFIEVSGAIHNQISCQTNGTFAFVLDGTTEQGQMYLSLILMAYATKQQVSITGYDVCDIYPGVANFRSIQIK